MKKFQNKYMEHETPEIETDQSDEEVFLITTDEFYDLLMEQQEQM